MAELPKTGPWKARKSDKRQRKEGRQKGEIDGSEVRAVVSPRVMSPHAGPIRPRNCSAI